MSCVLSWPKNLKVTKSKHKLTQNIANNLKKEMETERERESERKRGRITLSKRPTNKT